MRIISQSGSQSINLDSVLLYVNEDNVLAENANRLTFLGKYDTHDRAMEVFEEIHKDDLGGYAYYEMPQK